MKMLREIRSRIEEPFYVGLRKSVLAQIKSGELTEEMELSSILDSLDTVQLTMEIEELGVEPTVPLRSVGDVLWLFKTIDLKRERS
jgi:acyl carrier protein